MSTKIIDTNSIDYSGLSDLIPEADYYHSTSIMSREVSNLNPREGSLVGNANQSLAQTFNWIIGNSNNVLVNLNECYFDIDGELEFKTDGTKAFNVEDVLIPSDNWLSSIFTKSSLSVGGATISDRDVPIKFNIFNRLFFKGNQTNYQEGFAGTHQFKELPVDDNNDVERTHLSLLNFSNGSICPVQNNDNNKTASLIIPFTGKLYLHDIVDCWDLLPIFNQEIVLTLQREPTNSISIQTIEGGTITLNKFNHFDLKVFKYQLDPSVIKYFMKIYDTPRSIVFSSEKSEQQTVLSQEANSQYNINCSGSLLFGTKFMCIQLLKNEQNKPKPQTNIPIDSEKVLNTYSRKDLVYYEDDKNSITDFTLNYCGPHATRAINYNQILISADSYLLLYDNVVSQDQTYRVKANTKIPLSSCLLNNKNYNYDGTNDDVKGSVKVNPYSRLYHEYVTACKHTDVIPVSHEEFVNCYPSIVVNLDAYSRISTRSQMQIQIQNGSDYSATNSPYVHNGNKYTSLLITSYGLKAIQLQNGSAKLFTIDNSIHNSYDDQLVVDSQ